MHKKLVKAAVISSVFLLQVQGPLAQGAGSGARGAPAAKPQAEVPAANAEPNSSQDAPGYISTRAAFRAMMNDPELNQLNLRTQQRRLKTTIDFAMQNAFDNNPLLQQVLPEFEKRLNAEVLATTTKNGLTMQEVTSASNPKLYRLVQNSLRLHGYSDKQLKDTVVYVSDGDVNAYAYTFSPDKAGFVILTGLLDIANPAELRDVIDHEDGHIRSGHVKYGSLDTIMQLRLINIVASKNSQGMFGSSDALKLQEIKDDLIQSRVLSLLKPTNVNLKTNQPGIGSDANIKARQSLAQIISGAESAIGVGGPEESSAFLMDYVDHIITSLQTLEVPQKYLVIFQDLKLRLRPGDVIVPNLQQVAEALKIWSLAYSRELETTADYFGAINGKPSKSAMMAAKFSGIDVPEKPTSKEIANIAKYVSAQVTKSMRMNTRADYYKTIGGLHSSDHPYGNLRLLRQVKFDNHIDRIAVENPFLNFVSNLDEARTQVAEATQDIEVTQNLIAKAENSKGRRLMPLLKKKVRTLIAKREQALRNIAKLEPTIQNLLEDPAFKERHPRSTDLLDYRLAQKQVLEGTLANLSSSGAPPTPELTMLIATIQGGIQEMLTDPILAVAMKTLEGPGNSALEQNIVKAAREAFNNTSTLKDTMNARVAMRELSKSTSRIALEVDTQPKSANTIIKGVFKHDITKSKAAVAVQKAAVQKATPAAAMTCPQFFE